MRDLCELFLRTNIEHFTYNNKDIFVYDDHRTILNILFEAQKSGLIGRAPNLIYFDYHDDACIRCPEATKLQEILGKEDVLKADSKAFWSMVEFDLGTLDDDWLDAAMELNLIKDAVNIGAVEDRNVDELNEKYEGKGHRLWELSHLGFELGNRGMLGDHFKSNDSDHIAIREIFNYSCGRQVTDNPHPYVLDFDLDCFSADCCDHHIAWPLSIFREKYVNNYIVANFMQDLIQNSQFITICREPKYCGGLGESNAILSYLDKYFFNGSLNTSKII